MKRIVIFLCLCALAFPLRAQVATVEVSRPYDINTDGIRKPTLPTAVDDSLHRFDVHFDYSIFNRPYGDLYDFTPYESIQLSTVGANRTPFVYARLGSQYAFGDKGLMPAGEIYLQSKPRKGFCSGLYGRHNSFFGDLGRGFNWDPILKTGRMENTVGGDLTYDWETGEMMVDVKYDYDTYRFSPIRESSQFPCSSGHTNGIFTGAINLNSAQKEENSIYYDVTFSYRNTKKALAMELPSTPFDTLRMREHFLNVSGFIGASFDVHRIYIDMNIEYAAYGGVHDFNIGVVEFSPIYQYHRKRLDARLGVKFGSRYGMAGTIAEPGLDLTPRSSIFPDVDLRYTLVDKMLWAHAVVTGGNDLNPLSRMIDDCPLVLPDSQMGFGSRPLDATLSLEGVVAGRLGFNLEGIYKIYRNKMIFVPVHDLTGLPMLTAAYRDVNQYSVQAELFWRSQELTVGGRLRYASYRNQSDKSVVTEMPVWTGNASFRYNFRERIIAQVECNFRSSTHGYMAEGYLFDASSLLPGPVRYEVPPIIDLDLHLNYLINKNLSVFVKAGNLLNQRNQYMPLYLEPGLNLGGGICINF
ncbi:MAG: TonB-dependent receptor [Bacteroidales bacterium]|nr:TonB-dependent receptor [Bacteroidales bacterium]